MTRCFVILSVNEVSLLYGGNTGEILPIVRDDKANQAAVSIKTELGNQQRTIAYKSCHMIELLQKSRKTIFTGVPIMVDSPPKVVP